VCQARWETLQRSARSLSITSCNSFVCSGVKSVLSQASAASRTRQSSRAASVRRTPVRPIVLRTLHERVGKRLGGSLSLCSLHLVAASGPRQVQGRPRQRLPNGFEVPLDILTKATTFPRIHDQPDTIRTDFGGGATVRTWAGLISIGFLSCGLMKTTNLADVGRSFLGWAVHDARRRMSTQP
jgi:hypothetical protein